MKFPFQVIGWLMLSLVGCEDLQQSTANQRYRGAQPHLSTDGAGGAVLSWLTPAGDSTILNYSHVRDGMWSAPVTVAAGDDWFVNWADFPSVTPITPTFWAAHWLVKKPGGTYSYDVHIALTHDAGKTWQEAFVLHEDNTPTEHGFVTLFPWQGQLGAVWLDGRHTLPPDGKLQSHVHSEAGAMSLRAISINETGTINGRWEIDGRVCDCCATDVAISDDTPIAVYRDRSGSDIRDIFTAHGNGRGWKLNGPVARDNWFIKGCPVNGPAIDANGAKVAIAWYSAANATPTVRLAHSNDGGASYSPPLEIDNSQPLGRVDVIQLAAGGMIISWLDTDGQDGAVIVLQRINADGTRGSRQRVANVTSDRSGGFPQMVLLGDQVLLAWTDHQKQSPEVHTRLISLQSL